MSLEMVVYIWAITIAVEGYYRLNETSPDWTGILGAISIVVTIFLAIFGGGLLILLLGGVLFVVWGMIIYDEDSPVESTAGQDSAANAQSEESHKPQLDQPGLGTQSSDSGTPETRSQSPQSGDDTAVFDIDTSADSEGAQVEDQLSETATETPDTEVFSSTDDGTSTPTTDTDVYRDSTDASPAYCPTCGTELIGHEGVSYCPGCGESL